MRPNGDGKTVDSTEALIPYVYVFIRRDIPIHAQLVQSCHASLELGLSLQEKPDQTSFLILLQVDDKDELIKVANQLDMREVKYHIFYEPDFDMGHTAICTQPVYGSQRNFFKKFDLWKM